MELAPPPPSRAARLLAPRLRYQVSADGGAWHACLPQCILLTCWLLGQRTACAQTRATHLYNTRICTIMGRHIPTIRGRHYRHRFFKLCCAPVHLLRCARRVPGRALALFRSAWPCMVHGVHATLSRTPRPCHFRLSAGNSAGFNGGGELRWRVASTPRPFGLMPRMHMQFGQDAAANLLHYATLCKACAHRAHHTHMHCTQQYTLVASQPSPSRRPRLPTTRRAAATAPR